jgi:hypothetical protein
VNSIYFSQELKGSIQREVASVSREELGFMYQEILSKGMRLA